MSENKQFVLGVLGFFVLIFGLTWLVQGNDFFLHRYFDAKYEDNRREVFSHGKAYNDGFRQELDNMRFEYVKASPEHKQALASIILHRVAEYDEEKFPYETRQFLTELRQRQTQKGGVEK